MADRSLLINGLENKDKVIVELAEPEDTSIVVFVGLKDDKNNKAPVPSDELLAIPIDKHATVAELLTAVADTAGINRPDYRLRATNFMQVPPPFGLPRDVMLIAKPAHTAPHGITRTSHAHYMHISPHLITSRAHRTAHHTHITSHARHTHITPHITS